MIPAVVLAAGTSARLGRPKQLLELWGKPLLQHVVDFVSGCGFEEVVVVLGHAEAEIRSRILLPAGGRFLSAAGYRGGQAHSLAAGLAAVRDASAAAVFVGDQPGIPEEAVRRVLDAYADARRPFIRPLYRGRPGHPVVIARSAFAAVAGLTGDDGARRVMEERPGDVFEVELDLDLPPDLDTWGDVLRAASAKR